MVFNLQDAVKPKRKFLCRVGCLILLLAATLSAAATDFPTARADDKPAARGAESLSQFEENWQVIYIASARIGFGRSSTGRMTRDGKELVTGDSDVTMAMTRLGQSVKTKVIIQTEETPEGDLVSFQFEMQNHPAATTRGSGRVKGDLLILSTETNGKTTTKELPWDKSVKSPTFQDRLLRENPLKAGEKRTFKTFDPQFAKVSTVTIQAGARQNVKLLDGQMKELLEVTISQSLIPQIVTKEYLDEKGTALKSTISLMGMVTYTVSKSEALKDLTGDEVDLAISTMVKTAEIKQSHKSSRAVYRVTIPGEDPEKSLTTGPTQKIVRVNPNTVDLTVTAVEPPRQSSPGNGKAPGKEFLSPNSYLQSDDDLVRKHAAAAVKDEKDPWKAAQLMEKWVQENLKEKNFSILLASAAEVAKDLSGDCTEHAVLLAAMCRARGIPSRVAVGLVYVPRLSSFGGHMWTEVFVRGQWIPLDATLGQGGIAADHIKFADSSLSEEGITGPLAAFAPMASILGKMKIELQDVQYGK